MCKSYKWYKILISTEILNIFQHISELILTSSLDFFYGLKYRPASYNSFAQKFQIAVYLWDKIICLPKVQQNITLNEYFQNLCKVGAESFLISSANDENMLAGQTLTSRWILMLMLIRLRCQDLNFSNWYSCMHSLLSFQVKNGPNTS